MTYELTKKSDIQVAQVGKLDSLFDQMTTDDCVKFYDDDPNFDSARNLFEAYYKRTHGSKLPKGFVSYKKATDENGKPCKVLFITSDYPTSQEEV